MDEAHDAVLCTYQCEDVWMKDILQFYEHINVTMCG